MITQWTRAVTEHYGTAPLGEKAVEGIKSALVFAGALLLSLILTPVFRELARKLGMIDQPNERRVNKMPIPRGGGLSVFVAFHLALAGFVLLEGGAPVSREFSFSWQQAFLIGSSALVAVGFIDDKFGMRPFVKLACQVAVASFLFAAGIRINGILVAFPLWLDYAVTVFWIVGAVNAFNLIDGMDGLASGLALIASVGLAGTLFFERQMENMIPYCALGGACLGFLRYNFHPATVFLGDTGSMFLGLCVATLPLVSGSRLELVPSLIVPLLAMGIPIFDTLLAIWRRAIRTALNRRSGQRAPIMAPDKDHLHHRVLSQTMSQKVTAWMFYGISAALVFVGIACTLWRKRAPGVFLVAFIAAVAVIVKHLARVELWDTGRLLSSRRVAIRKGLITPLYVMLDLLILILVWLLACWVLYADIPRGLLITRMPLRVGAVFIALVVTKTYRRVWRRAQFSDFALLCVAVAAGVAVGAGLVEIFDAPDEGILRFGLVLAAFALPPLVLLRLAVEFFQGAMQALKRHALKKSPRAERLLVYGAGIRFRNYMREQTLHLAEDDSVIVGIIDDDFQFRGRVICGYDVLGDLDNIPDICRKRKIDRIVVTCLLAEENRCALLQMLKELNVKATIWVNEERDFT